MKNIESNLNPYLKRKYSNIQHLWCDVNINHLVFYHYFLIELEVNYSFLEKFSKEFLKQWCIQSFNQYFRLYYILGILFFCQNGTCKSDRIEYSFHRNSLQFSLHILHFKFFVRLDSCLHPKHTICLNEVAVALQINLAICIIFGLRT